MKNIGVIGCGNILETYLRSQEYFNNINFVSCSDINMDLAKKTASENNIKAQTVEELLSDNSIDIVLNITIPQAHFEVSKKILRHSEALGGISRFQFQMDIADITHKNLLKSIELIGKEVIPRLNNLK